MTPTYDRNDVLLRMKERELAKTACPDCRKRGRLVEMIRKCLINPGNDEGYGQTALYQCPECKNIEEI